MRSTVSDRDCEPSTLDLRGLGTNAGNRLHGGAIRKGIHPYGAGRGGSMELRCPNCKSADLKKVSLAYQEGLYRVDSRTRLRGVVVGCGGPDIVVGSASTKGSHQTEASKRLGPPVKWLYLKLISWSALAFLAVGWLVIYTHAVTTNSSTVSSIPLTIHIVVSFGIFVILFALFWRHNHSTYPQEYAQWDRSFICERCGEVSQ
jgi:hypothetical protein